MMVKNVKDINFEDEFVRVTPDTSVLEVSRALIPQESEADTGNAGETIATPLLAAYVMDGEVPVGIITKDILIETVVVRGLNPTEVLAVDIMKPPLLFDARTPVPEVVNAIIDQGLLTVAIVEDEKLVGVISVFDAIFLQKEMNSEET